jgi:XisH protein
MAKDLYHGTVRIALEKDGWTITRDPLTLRIGKRDVFVDLGAEKLIAAQREGKKIAVEIKSFISKSFIQDLENALGQYILYLKVLSKLDPERLLYLAVEQQVYINFFSEEIVQILLEDSLTRLIIFDSIQEIVTKWID